MTSLSFYHDFPDTWDKKIISDFKKLTHRRWNSHMYSPKVGAFIKIIPDRLDWTGK